jgi:hypothetical protein
LWLQKTDPAKPWSGLDFQVSAASRDLFNASVSITVGSGTAVAFWEDAWIGGLTAKTIAPALMKHVRLSVRRSRSVEEGTLNHG